MRGNAATLQSANALLQELAKLRQGMMDRPTTEWPALEAMDAFYGLVVKNADILLSYACQGVEAARSGLKACCSGAVDDPLPPCKSCPYRPAAPSDL